MKESRLFETLHERIVVRVFGFCSFGQRIFLLIEIAEPGLELLRAQSEICNPIGCVEVVLVDYFGIICLGEFADSALGRCWVALGTSHSFGAAYLGRYVVVVDDDIDVYDINDINDVLWAMCSRADQVDATEIIRRCWSGPLEPIIPKDRKGFSSRMIIDACRPFEWMANFPPAAEVDAEYQKSLMKKWKRELFS